MAMSKGAKRAKNALDLQMGMQMDMQNPVKNDPFRGGISTLLHPLRRG